MELGNKEIKSILSEFANMQKQVRETHRQWIASLAELFPQFAEVLWQYHEYYCHKQKRLVVPPLLLLSDPAIPLAQLAHEPTTQGDRSGDPRRHSSEESARHRARRERAQTQRKCTRDALISAAIDLIRTGENFKLSEVANKAGIGNATLYTHFATKEDLLDAAYAQLLEPILGSTQQ